MKVFILGPTGSGKSTLARKIQESLEGTTIISGGSWIREIMGIYTHGPEEGKILAEASRSYLSRDPKCSWRILSRKVETAKGLVILEGLRNPLDFFGMWEPGDVVVFLRERGHMASDFESRGLSNIEATLRNLSEWGANNVLLDPDFDALLSILRSKIQSPQS
jgi:energy-coupling factor transporter ATP-binding protein EcfA2